MTRIELENGKYTVVHNNGADFKALRNGEEWRSLTGDGLVLAMAYRIEELQNCDAAYAEVWQKARDLQELVDPLLAALEDLLAGYEAYAPNDGWPDKRQRQAIEAIAKARTGK